MRGLPDSKIYIQELHYWPYISSWKRVLNIIVKKTPKNGKLFDLMFGPGYLLGEVSKKRKDLKLEGQDIDKRYIDFAKSKYKNIKFELSNILKINKKEKYDVVICTGSLHHIKYERQEKVISKMASLVKEGGFVIISDCYIDDYKSEIERKFAAAKLGVEYLYATIANGAPDKVIESTIEILWNDVMKKEYKTSIDKRTPLFKSPFQLISSAIFPYPLYS